MNRNEIDWNDPPLQCWFGTTVRKGTQYFYRSAYRAYAEFTGMTATQLIDEAVEDQQRDVRQRQDIVKTRLRNFYEYLTKEFPVHSRGNSRGTKQQLVVRKGLREKSANAFVMAVRSFYATYDITVKLKGRDRSSSKAESLQQANAT